MLRLVYFFSLLIYAFSTNVYACMPQARNIINNTSITKTLNKKQSVIVPKKSSLVIDCSNLKKKPIILHQQAANEIRHPASLTKMMTIYLLLEAIQNKKVTFDTKFKVSKLATRQMPSKLNLKEGEKISVLDCIKALLVKSANDVAVVVAEGLYGSVPAFCDAMNKKAKSLGMRCTHYENPSGVPNKKQVTCANDTAILGLSIMNKFTKYWHLFSTKTFTYKNKTYNTHCKILRWYNAADGAKTGYICASGFNLWVTATKYNKEGKSKRLCAIVFGEHSGKERDFKAARLMDTYFNDYNITNKNDTKDIISKSSKNLNNDKLKNNKTNISKNKPNTNKTTNVSIQELNNNTNCKNNIESKKNPNNKMLNKTAGNNNIIPKQIIDMKAIKNNNNSTTNLKEQSKKNKILKTIDENINNVLNCNNTIQENNTEEDILYEIESFPMDYIIKSSGKSKEYFDNLYKDDVPLQIESSTPIDFSVPKKSLNKTNKKTKNKNNINNKKNNKKKIVSLKSSS